MDDLGVPLFRKLPFVLILSSHVSSGWDAGQKTLGELPTRKSLGAASSKRWWCEVAPPVLLEGWKTLGWLRYPPNSVTMYSTIRYLYYVSCSQQNCHFSWKPSFGNFWTFLALSSMCSIYTGTCPTLMSEWYLVSIDLPSPLLYQHIDTRPVLSAIVWICILLGKWRPIQIQLPIFYIYIYREYVCMYIYID